MMIESRENLKIPSTTHNLRYQRNDRNTLFRNMHQTLNHKMLDHKHDETSSEEKPNPFQKNSLMQRSLQSFNRKIPSPDKLNKSDEKVIEQEIFVGSKSK